MLEAIISEDAEKIDAIRQRLRTAIAPLKQAVANQEKNK
jgi:hypothetical protein